MTRLKVVIQVREKEILRAEKKGNKKKQSVPPLHFQWCIKSRVLGIPWRFSGQDCVFTDQKRFSVFLIQTQTKLCCSHLILKICWSYCWLRDTVRPLITYQGCKIQDSHGEALGSPPMTWCPGQPSHGEGVWSQARVNPGAHPRTELIWFRSPG